MCSVVGTTTDNDMNNFSLSCSQLFSVLTEQAYLLRDHLACFSKGLTALV